MAETVNANSNDFFSPILHGDKNGASWADEVDDHPVQPKASEERPEVSEGVESSEGTFKQNNNFRFSREQHRDIPSSPPFTAFIGNLSFSASDADLYKFFKGLEIARIRFPYDSSTSRRKGHAYVEFETQESLCAALNLDGESILNRQIRIDVAGDKRRSPTSGRRGPNRNRSTSGDQENTPVERPRLKLLPRKSSIEDSSDDAPRNREIFGDAKPRDEIKFLQRKKSEEFSRKSSIDSSSDNNAAERENQSDPLNKENPASQDKENTSTILENTGSNRFRKSKSNNGINRGNRDGKREGFGSRRGRGRGRGRGGRGERRHSNNSQKDQSDKEYKSKVNGTNKSVSKQNNQIVKKPEPKLRMVTMPIATNTTKIDNAFSALDSSSESDE